MFGQVLDKLDSYFGRAFLLSRYVPWLVCIAINGMLVAIEFPAWRSSLRELLTDLMSLLTLLLSIGVLAYATSPTVQFATRFLEGSAMPDWLRRLLALSHAWRRDALDGIDRKSQKNSAEAKSLKELLLDIRSARAEGARLRAIYDPRLLDDAEQAVTKLMRARQLIDRIDLPDFTRAVDVLRAALRKNCAEASLLTNVADVPMAERLDSIYELMYDKLAPYVSALAERDDQVAATERSNRFASQVLAPTGLGNEAAALRDYCSTRYGIDFDFFWPRFLMVVRNDAKVSESLSSAKIQLDFSVLMLVLSSATFIGWFGYLILIAFDSVGHPGLDAHSVGAAILVLGLGPLAVYAWLGIVHAAYLDFAEVVRNAIDLRRFDVLVGLRQALPASTSDERRCWEAVQQLALFDEHESNVSLRHPAS